MRLEKFQIAAALVAAVLSFSLYVSPLPPVLLSLDQAHEVLLAVFGAGVSILFAEFINYAYHARELEGDLLETAEPLISSLAQLGDLTVENVGDDGPAVDLLVAYFEEEESNAFWANNSSPHAPSHVCRNRLICAIENCGVDECDKFASDPFSSFSRYVLRAKGYLDDLARKYRWCDEAFRGSGRDMDAKLARLSYLSGLLAEVPLLRRLPGARKTRSLKRLKSTKAKLETSLEPTFQMVRLFYSKDKNYLQLLFAFLESRESLTALFDGRYGFDGGCALMLFEPLSEFASVTKVDAAKHYIKPWWR